MFAPIKRIIDDIGNGLLFLGVVLRTAGTNPWSIHLISEQIWKVSMQSLATTAMAGFFVGAIMTVQFTLQVKEFGALGYLGGLATSGTIREVGPLLIAFMLSGKVGAFTSAELGTMRVTEQIDALVTLSTNAFKYLVGPRLIAAVITLPILVAIGDTIGIMGGYIVGTRSLGFNSYAYIKTTADFLHLDDVTSGLIKAAVFGLIIAIMGCYHGFNSKGGAQGVGRATTNAVVSASILILAANFALTNLLFTE